MDKEKDEKSTKKHVLQININLDKLALIVLMAVIGVAVLGNVVYAKNPSEMWTALKERITPTPRPPTITPLPTPANPPRPTDPNQHTCYKPDGSWFYTSSDCDDFQWDSNSELIGSTPTIKPTIVKKVPQPTTDTDPPVHCQIDTKCGGGTKPMKKSECDASYCCYYPEGAQLTTKEKCDSVTPTETTPKNNRIPILVEGIPRSCDSVAEKAIKEAESIWRKMLADKVNCLVADILPDDFCESNFDSSNSRKTLDDLLHMFCG